MNIASKIKAEIARLEKQLEYVECDGQPMVSPPDVGSGYWIIDCDGPLERYWDDDIEDRSHLSQGQAYASEASALRAERRMRAEQKLRTLISALAPNWRANWSDYDQKKAHTYYDYYDNIWRLEKTYCLRTQGAIYFPPEIFDDLISGMGDEMQWLL